MYQVEILKYKRTTVQVYYDTNVPGKNTHEQMYYLSSEVT